MCDFSYSCTWGSLTKLQYWFIIIMYMKISLCIDLNLEDEILQLDSETTLKQDITWAFHLSLEVCIQMVL